ncbi:hypothetical protein TNCV_4878101 [Trichonephila clavipes]|nr:hypothetical protein TNCV_4878101 [Trichonephila clavipes]
MNSSPNSKASEQANINVALFSYTRALAVDLVILSHGQVMRKASELAPPSSNYHNTDLSTDLTCIAPLDGGSSVVLGSNS